MGLLRKKNKKMCDQVEILCTRVVTMGDSRPFAYLSPPFYLNDSNIIGLNRYWAANEIRANNYSWLFSLGGLSKFAVETLRLKGTKRGKMYNISSRTYLHPWAHTNKLYIYFGQMACVVSVTLKQDIPCINGFVKVYKDGTFEYGQ